MNLSYMQIFITPLPLTFLNVALYYPFMITTKIILESQVNQIRCFTPSLQYTAQLPTKNGVKLESSLDLKPLLKCFTEMEMIWCPAKRKSWVNGCYWEPRGMGRVGNGVKNGEGESGFIQLDEIGECCEEEKMIVEMVGGVG